MAKGDDSPKDPTRRRLMRGGLGLTGALIAGRAGAETPDPLITRLQQWETGPGDGVDANPYGMPVKFEADVVRRNVEWFSADPISAVNFSPIHALDGILTPNGLCFERQHSGAAVIPPGDWRLMVHGMVDQPMVFTLEDLMRFPRVNRTYFLECAANTGMEWRGPQMDGVQFTHGMIHNVMYTGVRLKDVLAAAGVKPGASWLLAEGADAAAMSRSIPLEKALDDCLIAFRMNGEALRAEQGYPARLVVPGWEGNVWIKWLRRLKLDDKPWAQREETSKYTDLMADGTAREMSFVMEAKSVITSPAPENPVRHGKGPLVISGIAWSGRGRIARVDVSLDGGVNWRAARIDGPSWSRALHRFYLEIDWDGRPLLLQSRAVDETGYVQPAKDALRKLRGLNSAYHMNGIQTWAVDGEGKVTNVEVG